MGGANADERTLQLAYDLGIAIAENGWILLNGGRKAGVMQASARGAKKAGGLTIGILPTNDKSGLGDYIDIAIITGLSDARNLVNVLSSDIIVACKGSAGTISEIALALKNDKRVILLDFPVHKTFQEYFSSGLLTIVENVCEAVLQIKAFLD